MAQLPAEASYRATVLPSIWAGIAQVWREAASGDYSEPEAAETSS